MTRTIYQDFIDVVYHREYKNPRAKQLYNLLSQCGEIVDASFVLGNNTLCIGYKAFTSDFTPITSFLWHEYGLILKGFRTKCTDDLQRIWIQPLMSVRKGSLA